MLNQHTPFDASAKSYSKELHLRLLERLLEIIIIQVNTASPSSKRSPPRPLCENEAPTSTGTPRVAATAILPSSLHTLGVVLGGSFSLLFFFFWLPCLLTLPKLQAQGATPLLSERNSRPNP